MRLQKIYNKKVIQEKKKFKHKIIDDVIYSRSSEWYSEMKRLANQDEKHDTIKVEEIDPITNEAEAEAIAVL